MNKLLVCIAAIERIKKNGGMGSVETIHAWTHLMVVSDSFKSIEGTEFHRLRH